MGMPEITRKQYRVQVLTEHYQFASILEPFGLLMIYLNDADHPTLLFKNVNAATLDNETDTRLDILRFDEVFLRRDEIVMIRFMDPVSRDTVSLMPRREKLRVFLPRFVVQATFACGAETRVADFFEGGSYWAPALEVIVRPILPAKHPTFSDAPLVLINKKHVRFYTSVTEQPKHES